MLKKKITFIDLDGNERIEEFHFNLTKAELTKMNLGKTGGLINIIQKITETQDMPKIMELFEEIITSAFGEKSLDGRRFIKDDQLTKEFMQTEAYSQLYMELLSDTVAAADFIKGIVPKDLAEQMEDDMATNIETELTGK